MNLAERIKSMEQEMELNPIYKQDRPFRDLTDDELRTELRTGCIEELDGNGVKTLEQATVHFNKLFKDKVIDKRDLETHIQMAADYFAGCYKETNWTGYSPSQN